MDHNKFKDVMSTLPFPHSQSSLGALEALAMRGENLALPAMPTPTSRQLAPPSDIAVADQNFLDLEMGRLKSA